MRGLLATTTVVAVLLGFAGTAAGAAHAPAPSSAQAQPEVALLDAAGMPRTTPYFDVEAAFPGMPPIREVIVVHNPGGGAAAHELRVSVTGGRGRHFLGDVLVLSVTSSDASTVHYRGPVVDAQLVASSTLGPGHHARYTVELAWPDGGASDNAYQGQTMSFAFSAVARTAD